MATFLAPQKFICRWFFPGQNPCNNCFCRDWCSQDLPPVLRSQELQRGVKVARNPPSPGWTMEEYKPFWSLGNYGNLEPKKKNPSFWKKKIVGQIEEDWSFFVGTQMLRMATSLCSILGEMQYLFGSCFRVLVPTVAAEVFQVLLRADYTQGKPIQIQSTKSAQDCSESNTWCPIQINEYYNLPTSIVSVIMSRNPCPKIPPLWAARHASQASATHVLIPDFPFLRAGFCWYVHLNFIKP